MNIKVHTTTNYDQFKFVFGNREINDANLQRIRKSVETDGALIFIMVVNDKMEIIDGQHRFIVWREKELPINYIIKNGYGLPQVHTFNQNTKNWGLNEFMESYVNMKYKDYEMYKFFKKKYKFGHAETMALLTNGTNQQNSNQYDNFRKGKFKIKSYASAINTAEKVYDFEQYYNGFKRRTFVYAITKLVNANGIYNHDKMINKISYQSAKLTDQSTTGDYLRVLEGIYNYRSREPYARFDLIGN